jgi:hypothetical protein
MLKLSGHWAVEQGVLSDLRQTDSRLSELYQLKAAIERSDIDLGFLPSQGL